MLPPLRSRYSRKMSKSLSDWLCRGTVSLEEVCVVGVRYTVGGRGRVMLGRTHTLHISQYDGTGLVD